MAPQPLRIGTRGSPLALAQSNQVRDLLIAAHPDLPAPELTIIKTTGDQVTDRPLADVGGKGLFTKEIEQALLDGAVDIAVHSMKDVETWLPEGLTVDCFLPREDSRDTLLGASSIGALAEGALVGTASMRRSAQLLAVRPDLKITLMRGNVGTRLQKLAAGEVDATLLAVAGLKRLGLADAIGTRLDPGEFLPAVAQGAVGIERRADDGPAAALLASLNDSRTALCVTAERAMLAALDGTCRTPIGGLATLDGDQLTLDGLLVWPDGSGLQRFQQTGDVADAARIGALVGQELRQRAGSKFFESLV
ncbi:MAG: hydroxymethylbilane synthase [Alphaproteobacteria bacterium]|nr:hydroxymethylbilane synthase [Alphaproteobacteria bacterium]